MTDPALHRAGLQGVHFLTTQARFWALQKEPHDRIAALLDDTEYLLVLLFDEEDRTDEFLQHLQQAANNHQCLHAYNLVAQQAETIRS